MKNNRYTKIIPLSLGVIILSLLVSMFVLAWREPTLPPPQERVEVRAGAMATTTGTPIPADCDEAIERGRVRVDPGTNRQYICGTGGWVFLTAAPARHTLTVSVTGTGTVVSSPAGISCPATCTAAYLRDTSVSLTATPGAGWAFTGWGGACSGTGTCTVVMNGDRTVTATFAVLRTLSISISGTGTVSGTGTGVSFSCTANCNQSIAHGTTVTLTATGAGWAFTGWGGACTGTGTCTVTMTENRSVTATFAQPMKFLYYTATTHTGNLGGRSGANSICAGDANRPAACTLRWWAFISVSDSDEVRDFPTTIPGFNTAQHWNTHWGAHFGELTTTGHRYLMGAYWSQ